MVFLTSFNMNTCCIILNAQHLCIYFFLLGPFRRLRVPLQERRTQRTYPQDQNLSKAPKTAMVRRRRSTTIEVHAFIMFRISLICWVSESSVTLCIRIWLSVMFLMWYWINPQVIQRREELTMTNEKRTWHWPMILLPEIVWLYWLGGWWVGCDVVVMTPHRHPRTMIVFICLCISGVVFACSFCFFSRDLRDAMRSGGRSHLCPVGWAIIVVRFDTLEYLQAGIFLIIRWIK